MLEQLLLKLSVNVCLLSQPAPQEEAGAEQAEREDLPPGPLVVAPHGAVDSPDPVTGFAAGELDGLALRLAVISGLG